jgi:exonuclease SbcD
MNIPTGIMLGEIILHFMPFWEDAVWLEKFKKVEPVAGKINILLSHIAINGSVNNDGSKVSDSGISANLFKPFSSVLLGHYHNQSKPASNVYHLPSLNQSSFGEDDQKGFTVLYSDGSHELVLSRAPKYLKLEIDLATTKKAQIEKIKKEYGNSGNHIEVSLIGPEKMVSSIDKEQFESIGIRVKKKASVIQDELDDPVDEVEELPKYNSSSIKEEFTAFLDQEAVSDRELGIKLLNKKLGVC